MKHLRIWLARFDALSLRERGLVFGTVLLVTAAFWYLLLLEPALRSERAAVNELSAVRERIRTAEQAMTEQVRALPGADMSTTAARLERLQRRTREVEHALEAHVAELIDPAEMTRVLRDVLERQRGLRLRKMRNLGAKPLIGDGEASGSTLYQHGLELTFEGSYLACLAYLEELEALPWSFYWSELVIDAREHPENVFRIQVSTLSFDKEWIGV